ncbi:hypothetical protein CERSUDRAFT_117080 [Gelatoporia subvermispora B]|uniref:Uncharacterized protein n=1 Tax=Ceriporiopsis subvermispora (strain B) TaxID=914234 RepID=M2QPT8_CERS8|nr:hypothetical protein CERSUDRAFT_117080 [Gelatoporia subvermispora B]
MLSPVIVKGRGNQSLGKRRAVIRDVERSTSSLARAIDPHKPHSITRVLLAQFCLSLYFECTLHLELPGLFALTLPAKGLRAPQSLVVTYDLGP